MQHDLDAAPRNGGAFEVQLDKVVRAAELQSKFGIYRHSEIPVGPLTRGRVEAGDLLPLQELSVSLDYLRVMRGLLVVCLGYHLVEEGEIPAGAMKLTIPSRIAL